MRQKILDLLSTIDENPALALRTLGFKGNKKCDRSCPIAKAIHNIDPFSEPRVYNDFIEYTKDYHREEIWFAEYGYKSIIQFIKDFDTGRYPDLEKVEDR